MMKLNMRTEFIGFKLTPAEREIVERLVEDTGAVSISEGLRFIFREAAEARGFIDRPKQPKIRAKS